MHYVGKQARVFNVATQLSLDNLMESLCAAVSKDLNYWQGEPKKGKH